MDDIRGNLRVDCDLILNKMECGRMNVCLAKNISLGGVRLQRVLEPQKDREAVVRLEMELPGDCAPIQVTGTKIYDRDEFVGIKFTNMTREHRSRLVAWMERHLIDSSLPAFS